MTSSFSYFTGIDVSKDKVDIFSTEKSSHVTVRNSKKQIREALYHFDREHTLIVLENTGAVATKMRFPAFFRLRSKRGIPGYTLFSIHPHSR